ncbi:hypothetical protein HYU82_03040 [Candidatus Saccharibacteria bacterium]|nr:hypothetical protein [Candidatus Saccharibacteria bacterium]MBI2285772.1 hypothetical protein [Candidatus Saccharibacteria bacterium]
MSTATKPIQAVKVLPWGEEVYLEVSINKRSANKFYARHGRTSEGKDYIEFSKFGPKPNTENEMYSQKLRIFSPAQWATIKHHVEGELSQSAGWDLEAAQKDFEVSLTQKAKENKK